MRHAMRFLLGLLSLFALTLSPLAAPAQAMTADTQQAYCAEMESHSGQHPAKSQTPDDARCCPAVPAALPPSVPASSAAAPIVEALISSTVLELAGLRSEAEDPPPRS